MAMSVLQVVGSAYRATVEDEGDRAVRLIAALKQAGADLAILLRGNAVNYAVHGQDPSGLCIGGRTLARPPRVADDLTQLLAGAVDVYVVVEDAADRGLLRRFLIDGIKPVKKAELATLFDKYDQVWHW